MDFNSVVFQPPQSSYSLHDPDLYLIPRASLPQPLPVFYSAYKNNDNPLQGSPYFLIYFHGNSEDIGLSQEFLSDLQETLCVNTFAVEYPNYGVYKYKKSLTQILRDSEDLYLFLTKSLKVHSS